MLGCGVSQVLKACALVLSGASFYLSLEALSIWTAKSELSVMVYTGVTDTTADKDAQGLLTLAV